MVASQLYKKKKSGSPGQELNSRNQEQKEARCALEAQAYIIRMGFFKVAFMTATRITATPNRDSLNVTNGSTQLLFSIYTQQLVFRFMSELSLALNMITFVSQISSSGCSIAAYQSQSWYSPDIFIF
jgi:hypothetical protein